jgi:uncharacterized membrane protein
MPENVQNEAPSMASLVGGIIHDAERLVRQEVLLARRELQVEFDKAKYAGVSLAAGAGLAMLGAVFLCLMLVFLLHDLANLSLWAGFLIVGGVLALAGVVMLVAGARQLSHVSLVPPQTAETLQENVQWLRNQT